MSFTGYRIFNVLYFGEVREPILASLNQRPHYYKFFGPVCTGADPFRVHHGGFYAFKNALTLHSAFDISMGRSFRVFGHTWAEVEMYGNVVEHTDGYRSQKLRFSRIFIPRHTYEPHQIEMLGNRYQCDVGYTDDHPLYTFDVPPFIACY